MNDVSPELLTLGITHDSSLALVLYLCWFIINSNSTDGDNLQHRGMLAIREAYYNSANIYTKIIVIIL